MAGSGGLPLRAVKIPKILTLPESNSESPWKRRGWKTKYPFWEGLFSGAFFVSFRECNLDMFFGDWFFRI